MGKKCNKSNSGLEKPAVVETHLFKTLESKWSNERQDSISYKKFLPGKITYMDIHIL